MWKQHSLWLTGFTLFAMFFGAGNVTFPLLVGQYAAQHYAWAMGGLLLTAVATPILCLLSILLFQGDYKIFFTRIGRWPGWILLLLGISLLGPLMVIPRTVTVAHAALGFDLLNLPLMLFSGLFCVLVFLGTIRESVFTYILGYILTPLLVIFCLLMISAGLFLPPEMPHIQDAPQNFFVYGLVEGYFTFDAIAALFFAGLLLTSLRSFAKDKIHEYGTLRLAFSASLIGGGMLGLIYLGLAAVSARHGYILAQANIPPEQILTALAYYLLPGKLGIFASVIVMLACFTTALALTKLFAEFLQDISRQKISYAWGLVITLSVAWIMSALGFSGLIAWFAPIIKICYPIVIALSIYNAAGWVYRRYACNKTAKTPA